MNLTIPVEAVATYPLPGTVLPNAVRFSPDNEWITFLDSQDNSLTNQLYRLHLVSGKQELLADSADIGSTEENLSLEAKLHRERLRQRSLGITQYAWGKLGHILIPLPTGLYILDEPGQSLRLLVSANAGTIQNGRFSPNGQFVTYVQHDEIHLVSAEGGASIPLTFGAKEAGKTHGLAEYIAQEEMGRRQGYWWAPNSRMLAYTEVDEQHIPIYRIMHLGKEAVGESAQEDHRYPFAGKPNAKVRLAVISIDEKQPVWMDLGDDEDIYLARVSWAGNGRLIAQILNREQTRIQVVLLDPTTGEKKVLLEEKTDVWINLHNEFRVIPPHSQLPAGGFIWASEKTGFRHLYLHDWQGNELRPLTQGEWMVDALAAVDHKNQQIYFTATKESPAEKHLYRTGFYEAATEKLTYQSGIHQVSLNLVQQSFIDITSNIDATLSLSIVSLKQLRKPKQLFVATDSKIAEYQLRPPQIVTFQNRTNETLYGAIYHPPAHFGQGPFPTIVSVYGGPHAQRVTNQWLLTADLRAQFLSQHGFLVFKCDNRGSARRGLAFEGHLKYDMGNHEVMDQVDGVQWLAGQGLTDIQRVGIYGWSYGGYMALMCLAKAGDIFKTAVSGAPVTHWDGYDTCYTERYMGLPQQNPEGYERSSVMHHIESITGNLMIIHGLIDENVHFRHTARLINALIKARKPYDLRLFPDERHSPRGLHDRIYMEEQIRDYFVKTI